MKDSDEQKCSITSLFLMASANPVSGSGKRGTLSSPEIVEEANPRGNSTARFPVHLHIALVEEFCWSLGAVPPSAWVCIPGPVKQYSRGKETFCGCRYSS